MNASILLAEGGDLSAHVERIPPWIREILLVLGILLALLVLAFATVRYLLYRHRKAYNLTKVEHAKASGKKPAFLDVDHEARAEAIRRGDEYVRPADREAVPEEVGKKEKRLSGWAFVVTVATVIAAIGHAGILVVAILDHAKDADTVWQELTAADRLSAVVSKYWLGFTLAGFVIVAQIVRFVASRKTGD